MNVGIDLVKFVEVLAVIRSKSGYNAMLSFKLTLILKRSSTIRSHEFTSGTDGFEILLITKGFFSSPVLFFGAYFMECVFAAFFYSTVILIAVF